MATVAACPIQFGDVRLSLGYRAGSWLSLAKNRQYIPAAVKDTDNLQRVALGVVHNDVIREGLDRPKPKWKRGYLLAGATTKWTFGQEGAGIVNCRFHTISCLSAVPGDVTPNRE